MAAGTDLKADLGPMFTDVRTALHWHCTFEPGAPERMLRIGRR